MRYNGDIKNIEDQIKKNYSEIEQNSNSDEYNIK